MKVEKIDHIHAWAKDAGAAARLFAELLGSRFGGPWESEEFGVRAYMNPKFRFEFVEPTSPDSPTARMIAGRPEGIVAISLKVPDINEAMAELESRGIKLQQYFEVGNIKEALYQWDNTFGVQIELCEYEIDDLPVTYGPP